MTDIAGLGFSVNSTDAQKASNDLNELTISAGKAETSVSGMAAKINSSFSSMTGPMKSAETSAKAMAQALDLREKFNPLYAASKRYEASLDELNMAVKVGAINAKQYDLALSQLNAEFAALSPAANTAAAGMQRVGAATAIATKESREFQGRMLAMQLSQVAQYGAVTGNYLQALAIQIPDLTLAFGPLAIMAGAFLGTLAPIAVEALKAGDEIESFEDQLGRLHDTMSSVEDVTKVLRMTMGELVAEYGEATERTRRFAVAQAELAVDQAERRLRDQVSAMGELSSAYEEGYWNVSKYEGSISELVYVLDSTRYQARLVAKAIADAGSASTFEGQIEALERLLNLSNEMGFSLNQLPPAVKDTLVKMLEYAREADAAKEVVKELEDLLNGVSDKTSNAATEAATLADKLDLARKWGIELDSVADAMSFSSAIDDATTLAEKLGIGAGFASQIAAFLSRAGQIAMNNLRAPTVPQVDAGESGMFVWQDYVSNPNLERDATLGTTRPKSRSDASMDFAFPDVDTGGGGGGGGGSSTVDIEKQREAYEKLVASLDELAKATKRYADDKKFLDEALASGAIKKDQYLRGIELITDEYEEAAAKASEFAGAIDFAKETIVDMAMSGSASLEDLIDKLREAAIQAALLGEGPLAGIFQALFGIGEGGMLGTIGNAVMAAVTKTPTVAAASAKGNVVNAGRIIPHAKGGIVSEESYFPMPNGNVGSLAEEGEEAIMPLGRTSSGDLGVKIAGGSSQQRLSVEVSVADDGRLVAIAREAGAASGAAAAPKAVALDIANGGVAARTIKSMYGVREPVRG